MIIGAVVIIVLSSVAAWFALTQTAQPPSKDIRLVVLPIENLGLGEDGYFADSITDQMTSHLAPVRGLDVLSPRTASKYKTGERDIRAIGKLLGVDYILDGTVQRERPSDPNSRVLVIPQLIRASDDTLLWADRYLIYSEDSNELLGVQSDLAQQVAQALDVTLLEPQRRALASRRTENTEADRFYLRGYDYFNRSHQEHDFRIAIDMYKQAVELDPTFALAHARLSMAHSWMYWFYDGSDARLTAAREAADKAFELSPGLPEAHAALGRYHYSLLDFDSALEQFAIARESLPNDSEVLSNIGFCQRRQGKLEQALANIKRACENDPLSNKMHLQVGATLMLLRRYPEAEHYFEQGIRLSPDVAFGYFWKAGLYLQWQGDTEKARAVFEEASQNIDTSKDEWIVLRSVMLDVFDKDYPGALDRLSSYESEALDTQFYFIPKARLSGQIYGLMGNQQLARVHYESARSILEAKKQEEPKDARFRSSLGIVYAGLGREEDAIREGELGVELLPVPKDAWRGPYRVEDLARIYAMVGEPDAAIDRIEYLLKRPGELSVHLLRIDPTWDVLREHPRFEKLVEAGR
jgi:serine/threonine-protein kinase